MQTATRPQQLGLQNGPIADDPKSIRRHHGAQRITAQRVEVGPDGFHPRLQRHVLNGDDPLQTLENAIASDSPRVGTASPTPSDYRQCLSAGT
jgi:hypothetical protein